MFKIHFQQNKDTFIAVSLVVGFALLLIINGSMLIPVITEVLIPDKTIGNANLIDTTTVNSAIQLLLQ